MKRILSLILAAVLMGTLLVGCNEKSVGNATVSQPAGSSQTQPQTETAIQPADTESTQPEDIPMDVRLGLKTPEAETDSLTNYRVSLTEVATFESRADICAQFKSFPYIYTERDGLRAYTLLSYDGQDKLGEPVHSYGDCGGGIAITTVYTGTGPIRKLVNVNTGEVYLADDAVAILSKLSDRFYYAIYITEETDNEDECFLYATKVDDQIEMQTIFDGPAAGEQMYKGYGVVFDLQQKAFVEGIRIEDRKTEVKAHRDILCLHKDTGWTFYSADGSLLAADMTNMRFGEENLLKVLPEGCEIYDIGLNKIGFVEGAQPIGETNDRSSDRYLCYGEKNRRGIMTVTGEKITEPVYYGVYEAYGDYIVCGNEDGTKTVVYCDGSVVVPGGLYKQIGKVDGLPAFTLGQQNTYLLGGTYQEGAVITTGALYSRKGGDQFLVYSTGQWVSYNNTEWLSNGLLKTEEGIVELFTGSVLLPVDTDYYAAATDEYLYVGIDGVWTVYAITLSK